MLPLVVDEVAIGLLLLILPIHLLKCNQLGQEM